MNSTRAFDLILWGATGFTGRLVAEYLYHTYGANQSLKWAMAGRNQEKLEKIRAEVADENIEIVIADSKDKASLDAMAQRTKVICTTVGPYAKYGSDLVATCVEHQTDYCDLTGEVQWIRQMIDQHHEAAQANGTRIVHTCGFDSIPSDMGLYFFQQKVRQFLGEYCHQVKFRLKAAKGGLSGGTYASLANVLVEAEADKSIYKVLLNPYAFNPPGEREGPDKKDLQKVVYDKDVGVWISPFLMAPINTKVVRRSHALQGYPYGKDFRYDEAIMTGKGIGGRMKGLMVMASTGAMMAAKPNSLLKKGLDYFLPSPGEGPTLAEREAGFFNIALYGKLKDGTLIRGKVTGDRDPGYGSTCKMLGESAVCLALDRATTPEVAGVLTPAVAMGDTLLQRLQENAGLHFMIDL